MVKKLTNKKDKEMDDDLELPEVIDDVEDDKEEKGVGPDDYKELAKQIQNEYEIAYKNQISTQVTDRKRLKIFNNQRKDSESVGDTTMFSVFWTVLASLYDDRLMVEHGGREEGDEETANNLDSVAEFDYEEMQKDKIDFDWDFDTLFCGRGLVEMEQYHRDPDNNQFYPMPKVIDFLTFLRDPDATCVNGRDRAHTGAAAYMGYEIGMTKQDIMDNEHIFNSVKDGDFSELTGEANGKSLLNDAIEARADAQNQGDVSKEVSVGINKKYHGTVWYTHYEIGGEVHKVKVWLGNSREKVIGLKILGEYWPIIDRALYPHSHDWRGTTIPDLTEDKQRAKALALNLGLNAMKSDLDPTYIFDSNQISRSDLAPAPSGSTRYIPVDAENKNVQNAIMPLNKANPNLQLVNFIMETLDASAQRATATPDIQQGIQSQKDRPLGETNILAARTDTRYSLSAKLFGWSERDFWRHWYWMYKEYFADDIDEKMVRIVGAFGAKWRGLGYKEMICRIDPDIKIESKNVSRAKALDERRGFSEFLVLAIQDPTVNKRYGLKKLARMYGLQKDEIDRLFPMTIDERTAEQENDKLNKNEYVEIQVEDDHNVHLEILAKAKDTPAARAHRITHEQALLLKKTRPDLFPQDQNEAAFQDGKENVNVNQVTPVQQSKPTAPSQAPGDM